MEKLVPLAKIILSHWLQRYGRLLCRLLLHWQYLCSRAAYSVDGQTIVQQPELAIFLLVWFWRFMLGLIEYAGGGTPVECYVSALRMLALPIIFIYLLVRYAFQDLYAKPWCSN